MTATDVDVPESSEAHDTPAPRTFPVARVGFALAAVFLVTTVVFAVIAVDYKSDLDTFGAAGAASERDEVGAVAAEVIQAVLDYDYRDPEGSLAAVLAKATGDFAEEYAAGAPGIQQQFAAVSAVSSGVIKEIYVAQISAQGTAEAIVNYDQIVTGPNGPQTNPDRFVEVELVRLPEGWRVSRVSDLPIERAPVLPEIPDVTATTAAP